MTAAGDGEADAAGIFEAERRFLVGLAYRLLGSVADAEDVVQDAWLRWHGADRQAVEAPRAFLATVVTRLSLDRLKSARRRRETYVGAWLPEPLVEVVGAHAAPELDRAEDVSLALMLALERLSPLERAAFILHDVFDRDFRQVAAVLGRSEAACRQLAARGRRQVRAGGRRFAVAAGEAERIADAFLAAARTGDEKRLVSLLAGDAVLTTDGGGRRIAALNPIRGADRICRFYAGLARRARHAPPLWSIRVAVNGLPGRATIEPDGTLQTTAVEVADGRVAAVYVTRNPDKLRHLAPILPAADGAARH